MNIRITGSGSYIPNVTVTNLDFAQHEFYNEQGEPYPISNQEIAQKFFDITGIAERRYVEQNQVTSDIATIAAQRAIADAKVDPETLDYLIVAHNFGDVPQDTIQSDILPSLSARIKHNLKIKNPKCVAYDILFGCPGWVEGFIQAQAFIKAGMAKKCLVIGAETLSRVVDVHDRDSMIFADGAGATVVELSDAPGFLAYESASFTYEEAFYLHFGKSYHKQTDPDVRYIKMEGRKIYEFALINVPKAMKECLEKVNMPIEKLKKILIHQANEKMDEAIIKRFYKQFKMTPPEGIMPMNIQLLGNSSVATIPTLYDSIVRGELEGQKLEPGDVILFASVGSGMNINAVLYQY